MLTSPLVQTRELMRTLSFDEKLSLLFDLMNQVIQQSKSSVKATKVPPFPIFESATWSTDLPLRRQELYDERGR